MDLPIPRLEHICTLMVELDPIQALGTGRAGQRRIIPIIGGTVTGEALSGRVLNVGADWQTIFADGMAELDTRYAMETHDGAIIEIINYGYRHGPREVIEAIGRGEAVDPDSYYMRTQARLETGDPRYEWVNKTLFAGTGARNAGSVQIELYAIR
ncbi:DUF3237 domain-containing protein [Aestuariicoccus sp. MJ-SS9]|uniref:DUF3237 domain-containing protein n=1 Tax=Aestuariicoccus sp. MJ-SS9 TaxID=3079855 RepID=UPI002912EE04|nr:DUF3237 domain-containing protein [Aestuariicoccus sp. MJ-SS9]MDU8912280.1 DUF3237 domain-containing protein [Aestuariicoccus sp. MJ-SS9]